MFIWFKSPNSCLQFTWSDWKPKSFTDFSKLFSTSALSFIHIVCWIFFSNHSIPNQNSSLNLASNCVLNLQKISFGFGLIFNVISSHQFCCGSKSLIDLQIWFDLLIGSFNWIDLEENLGIWLVFLIHPRVRQVLMDAVYKSKFSIHPGATKMYRDLRHSY